MSDAREVEPSLGIKLLADLQTVFGKTELMPTTVILKALHDLTESPWNDLKGKPLNDRGLALRLRQYDVKSKQIRIGDITLKGYDRADLFDVWKRYLPQSSDKTKTSETSETKPDFQGPDASDVSDPPKMFRMPFRKTRPANVAKDQIKPTPFPMFRLFRIGGKAGAYRPITTPFSRNWPPEKVPPTATASRRFATTAEHRET